LAGVGLGAGKTGDSEYLLFVPKCAIDEFAKTCLDQWDALQPKPESAGKAAKKSDLELPRELKSALEGLFHAGRAADLALFGRMIADRPGDNVVAASQVAHALSTHRVDLEFDFYTAVDDLQSEGETGAGMMGTVEYNAACFYRYSNLDLAQLLRNLDGNAVLAGNAVEAFLRASIEAIPTGKQNSMAAQNPPSLVLAVVRDKGFWSLANAFLKPVRAGDSEDLMAASIGALGIYWKRLTEMYGEPKGGWLGAATLHPEAVRELGTDVSVCPVEALLGETVQRCTNAFTA
jgi:CRISPR system Cascade subunit CasC